MLIYHVNDRGDTIAFERIKQTNNSPAGVHVMIFGRDQDKTNDDPRIEFEINVDQFKKIAELVT
jgi:hypothetical protein